jgi:excisionase family DNA binding protein
MPAYRRTTPEDAVDTVPTHRKVKATPTPPPKVTPSPLWTIEGLAKYLGVPTETVRRWRSRSPRGGPPGLRVGKHVRFHPDDVRNWLDEQRDRS